MTKFSIFFIALIMVTIGPVIAQNNVADYPLNGSAIDVSGYGLDGILNGPTAAKDRFSEDSSAYFFDGIDDYIEVPANSLTDLKDGFSISAWFNSTGDNIYQTIVSRGYASEGTYTLTVSNEGPSKVIRVWLEGEVITGTTTIPDGWNHVVLVNNLGTEGVKIYLNGELYLTHTSLNTYVAPTVYNLRIGNNERDEDYFFDGLIDEVKVFDKSIDSLAVQSLFRANILNANQQKADFGNALHFDGINDFLQLPGDILNSVNQGFTVETWVKWDGLTELEGMIFEIVLGGDQVQGSVRFGVDGLSIGDNGQVPCSYQVKNTELIDNEWHHLAVTVSTELNKGFFVVDGKVTYEFSFATCELDGTCFYDACNLPPDTVLSPQLYGLMPKDRVGEGQEYANLFNLGRSRYGDFSFKGELDEFRIWDHPRTLNEIRSNRFLPISANSDGLVYYLNFDEGEANQNNEGVTNIPNQVDGEVGELLGFQLESNTSNWVRSDIRGDDVFNQFITDVFPRNVNQGQILTIFATNLPNDKQYVKALVDGKEATIQSLAVGRLEVLVPEGIAGMVPVEIFNSLGISNKVNIHVVTEESNFEFTWDRQTVYSQITPTAVETADFNQDGFIDIAMSGRNQLLVFLNDKKGNFPSSTIIQEGNLTYQDMIVFDVDADGDEDIIAVAGGNINDIILYKNEPSNLWSVDTLATTSEFVYLENIDADRDGLIDLITYGVVSSTPVVYGVKLFRNLGSESGFPFSAGEIIINGLEGEIINKQNGLEVADMNNDGFFDIVANTKFSDADEDLNTVVYLNNRGASFSRNRIGGAAPYSEVLSLADVNSDGHVDIGNIGFQVGFNVFVNRDNDVFDRLFVQSDTLFGNNVLRNGDINGDGLVDFVSGLNFDKNQQGGQINWYSQIDEGTYNPNVIPDEIFNVVDLRLADLDNDGDLDIIAVSDNDNRLTTLKHLYDGTDFYSYSVNNFERDSLVAETIAITVPNNFDRFRAKPSFELPLKSKAYVNGLEQFSEISEINASDTVTYTIRAESGNENQRRVVLNPLPGIPTIIELDDITANAAELEWELGTYTDAIELLLRNRDDEEDTLALVISADSLEYVLALKAGTRYEVQLRGINAFGYSEDYTEAEDFTTVPGQPIFNEVTDTTTSTAEIVWQMNQGTDFYLLEIATDPSFSNYLPGFNPATIVGSNTKITVTNLEDGTNYYARLASRNNDNETGVISQLSTIITFQTKFKVPSPPLAREASSVASTSFTANWDATTQGKAFGYIVEYADNIAFDNSQLTVLLPEQQRSLSITDLQQYTSYWYRVYTENESGRSTPSNTIFVKKELTIRNLEFDSLRDAKSISKDTISFEVTGGVNNYEVGVRYRGILSTDWTSRVVDKQGGKYAFRIRDSFLDEIGGEFELYVGDGTDTTSRKRNFVYWSDIENELPNLELAGKWQMFSIPYNFEDNLIETIFDEMGPYRYKKEWRLMQYDGSKYLDAGSGINRIELGESYWFYSLNKVAIGLENGTVNTKTPFKMSLMPGWNQIGNPYNIPVSWNSVRAKNVVTETVGKAIGFNSSSQQFEETDIISPFEGAFVWSDEAEEVDISLVDNKAIRQLAAVELTGSNIDEDRWVQSLYLATGSSNSSVLAAFGMHPDASNSKDSFDKMQLPRFVNYTEMYTTHEEYFYPRFSQDIQQTSEAQSWLYTLESNEKSGIHTISWKNEEFKRSEKQLWLIDEEKGVLVNMNTTDEYSFNWQGSYMLSLHLTESFEDRPTPYLLSVGDPFPNPISDKVYVNLSLPEAEEDYTLVINLFDIRGDLVSSRAIENLGSGFREVSLLTNETKPLTSGVYFFKIKVVGENTYNVTRKVVFQN